VSPLKSAGEVASLSRARERLRRSAARQDSPADIGIYRQQTRAAALSEGTRSSGEPTPKREAFVGRELTVEFGRCLFDEKVGEYVAEEGGRRWDVSLPVPARTFLWRVWRWRQEEGAAVRALKEVRLPTDACQSAGCLHAAVDGYFDTSVQGRRRYAVHTRERAETLVRGHRAMRARCGPVWPDGPVTFRDLRYGSLAHLCRARASSERKCR